jgi:hypothetical protein
LAFSQRDFSFFHQRDEGGFEGVGILSFYVFSHSLRDALNPAGAAGFFFGGNFS